MEKQTHNKEKWINEAMNSLDGIRHAEAPPYLFQKIEQKLDLKIIPIRTGVVSLGMVSIAAALIILLFSVNLLILSHKNRLNSSTAGIEKIATYYDLNDNNILDNL